jgi:hypothetical protein
VFLHCCVFTGTFDSIMWIAIQKVDVLNAQNDTRGHPPLVKLKTRQPDNPTNHTKRISELFDPNRDMYMYISLIQAYYDTIDLLYPLLVSYI